jgi:hypothetical protein
MSALMEKSRVERRASRAKDKRSKDERRGSKAKPKAGLALDSRPSTLDAPAVPGLPAGLLLPSRVVMTVIGLSKWDLQKYIDAGFLHPVAVPNPHRINGPNGRRGPALKFHRHEVVDLYRSTLPATR